MTWLAMFCPAVTLSVEADGRVAPLGQAVMYEAALAWVEVRLSTTAESPPAGTPPCPATSRLEVPPPLSVEAPRSVRVSVIRLGANGTNVPATGPARLTV